MVVPHVELEDIEALITLKVGSGGRISGLTEYEGREVIVVVPAQRKTSLRRSVRS